MVGLVGRLRLAPPPPPGEAAGRGSSRVTSCQAEASTCLTWSLPGLRMGLYLHPVYLSAGLWASQHVAGATPSSAAFPGNGILTLLSCVAHDDDLTAWAGAEEWEEPGSRGGAGGPLGVVAEEQAALPSAGLQVQFAKET